MLTPLQQTETVMYPNKMPLMNETANDLWHHVVENSSLRFFPLQYLRFNALMLLYACAQRDWTSLCYNWQLLPKYPQRRMILHVIESLILFLHSDTYMYLYEYAWWCMVFNSIPITVDHTHEWNAAPYFAPLPLPNLKCSIHSWFLF